MPLLKSSAKEVLFSSFLLFSARMHHGFDSVDLNIGPFSIPPFPLSLFLSDRLPTNYGSKKVQTLEYNLARSKLTYPVGTFGTPVICIIIIG